MTEKIKNLDKILIILLTTVIVSYIFFILKIPFINNYSHEEKLLSLISVKNFNEDGLLFTSLLPNYSINKDTTPFVYTHLNDLPSVINYYLLKIYNSEQILRISYSLITLSACVALVIAFSKKIPITLIIASFFYFITGKYYINVIDNLHYPMTLLVLSIQILIINLNSKKKLIFLTSINILVASFFSWIACLTIISGVVLYYIAYKKNEAIKVGLLLIFVFLITIIGKLFLNASYLGYEIAYKELLFTIANRITGIPSYQDLKEFFAVNGIVLWGSQVQEIGNTELVIDYWLNLLIKLYNLSVYHIILITSLIILAPDFFKKFVENNITVIKNIIIILLSLVSWDLIFLSHSKGYSNILAFQSILFLRIIIVFYILYRFIEYINTNLIILKNLTTLFTSILLILSFTNITNYLKTDYKYFSPPNELINIIDGKTVYTNISLIFIGYFQNNIKIAGRCLPSVIFTKDPKKDCSNIFENLYDPEKNKIYQEPNYFIFNSNFRSGNMDYSTDEKLATYKEILNNNLIHVKTFKHKEIEYILYKF